MVPRRKRILFVAAGSDGQPRSYVQDVDGGEARAITDETEQAVLVSPDGKLLAAVGADGRLRIAFRSAAASRGRFAALCPATNWSSGAPTAASFMCGGMDNSSVEFFRLNLATGRREPWKKIELADPVGLIGIQPAAVRMTPDGRSYVYSYWRTLTELYLVDNLK